MAEGTESIRFEPRNGDYLGLCFDTDGTPVLYIGLERVRIDRDEAIASAAVLRAIARRIEAWSTPVLCDGVSTKEASL